MKTTNVSGIYIIRNAIDGRVYVGSAVSLAHRKSEHFKSLRQKNHHNIHLQNFVNKYGINNICFEVLELCDRCNLIEREQYYFSVYSDKFNIAQYAGSSLGRVCHENTRRKISNSLKKANLKGIKKSEQTKMRMRKPKSKEHALKIKHAQRAVIKTVYQYDLELNLIEKFESVAESARKTRFDRRQISACCNNKKQNTVKGYIFTFGLINEHNIDFYKSKIERTLKHSK